MTFSLSFRQFLPLHARCYSTPSRRPTPRKPHHPFGYKASNLQWGLDSRSTTHHAAEEPPLTDLGPPAGLPRSVELNDLPPFTTLNQLSRIALRAGCPPSDVLSVHLKSRLDFSRGPRSIASFNQGIIHFRTHNAMTAFSRRPLLLHVQSGQVELFPSDSIRYTEQELENIAKVAQPWNRHASSKTTEEQQVSDHSESETEPTSESETETTSEPETDSEAELSETEINWQWSDSDSELEDETPLAARVFSVALTSFFSPKYSESMIRQFKLRRQTRWLLLQIAGSEPTRLPHSHVTSMKEGMQPIEIHSPELKTEQQSATVQRLSEAVAESYNREQQLEVELASMRARTREDALKIVQLTVENQIRQDLGTYGPLEGVWVRGVPVKRGDDVIHELHALVACSDIYTAVRVHTFLPFHDPETYPANRIRYTDQPWPEALGDRGSSSSQASFRMGWARIIEEHTREEAEAAYRDKTRSVSREEAHGRWGKESLEEIRERIRRISADM